jgi:hypothetical protein
VRFPGDREVAHIEAVHSTPGIGKTAVRLKASDLCGSGS